MIIKPFFRITNICKQIGKLLWLASQNILNAQGTQDLKEIKASLDSLSSLVVLNQP